MSEQSPEGSNVFIFNVGEEQLKLSRSRYEHLAHRERYVFHKEDTKITVKDIKIFQYSSAFTEHLLSIRSLCWLTKGKLLVTFSLVSKPTVRRGDLITLSWIIGKGTSMLGL